MDTTSTEEETDLESKQIHYIRFLRGLLDYIVDQPVNCSIRDTSSSLSFCSIDLI